MAQGYYTLEEAANLLGMSTDDLKQMARRGEIRSFQDRGTWRFRVQDIQELARRRGAGSDPELVLGDVLKPTLADGGPKSSGPRSAGPKSGPKPGGTRSSLAGTPKPAGTKSSLAGVSKPGGTKSSLAGGPGSTGPKSGPRSSGPASPGPKSAGPKSAGSKSPNPSRLAEVFDFTLEVDDAVDIGTNLGAEVPGGSKKAGAKSGPKHKGPASPAKSSDTPPPGYSDSDSRLVTEDPIDFQIEMDSDVRLGETPRPARSPSKLAGKAKLAPPGSSKRKLGEEAPAPPDSGVRLVPMDSDSDVRITDGSDEAAVPLGETPPRTAADSDIRLELDQGGASNGEKMLLTEEIDLDAELKKEAPPRPARVKPAAPPALPTSSPFELTDSELVLPDDSDLDMPAASAGDYAPLADHSSPLEGDTDDDFKLELPEDEVGLGDSGAADLKGPSSGLNLANPVDSGISLEQESEGSDELDFTLTVEDEPGSPRTKMVTTPSAPAEDESSNEFELALDSNDAVPALKDESSSEFELSLEADAPVETETAEESSSEFELTLDEPPSEEGSSDFELTVEGDAPVETEAADEGSSEFELTLDAGEGTDLTSDSEFELSLEEAEPTAKAEDSDSEFELSLDSGAEVAVEGDVGEIELDEDAVETPALDDDESGSEVLAVEEEDEVEADLESEDFDLTFGAEDSTSEDESASEVMAIDEEEAGLDEEVGESEKGLDFGGLDDVEEAPADETDDEPAELATVGKEVVAAPWGPLPVVFMLPCVVVLFLVGVMGFEMVQSMTGYKQPGLVTRTLSSLVGMDMKN